MAAEARVAGAEAGAAAHRLGRRRLTRRCQAAASHRPWGRARPAMRLCLPSSFFPFVCPCYHVLTNYIYFFICVLAIISYQTYLCFSFVRTISRVVNLIFVSHLSYDANHICNKYFIN